jgi:hypothetical protein
MADWLAVAAVVVGALTLLVGYRALRHGVKQLESSRRAAEAGIAAEVRALNGKCRAERMRVLRGFPLHVSLLERHPPETWEIVVDGEQVEPAVAADVVSWLRDGDHRSVRTWESLADLTDEQIGDAGTAVGFMNDLCQMLSDGTPGHFIFQQYHQQILVQGTLVIPLVHLRQAAGRWGVRLPSLVNRAALYHELRQIHRSTTIKIVRPIELEGADDAPPAVEGRQRVELMIPIADAVTETTGGVRYDDVDGREVAVDYDGFVRHYRNWQPPKMLP